MFVSRKPQGLLDRDLVEGVCPVVHAVGDDPAVVRLDLDLDS